MSPCPSSKPSSVPCLIRLASDGKTARSAARMPRTRTPVPLNGEAASAGPSTIGATSFTPSTLATRSLTCSHSVSGRSSGWMRVWAVEAEDLVEQFLAEPIHDRHHDDEGRDAEHDAEERKPGDHGDESFAPSRAQIPQRQHPLEGRERVSPGRIGHE